MMIFVLVSHYIDVDSGDFNSSIIGAFEHLSDAIEELEKSRDWVRCDFKNCDNEENDAIEDNYTFSIWEKDYEMSHRCELKIEFVKVKQ